MPCCNRARVSSAIPTYVCLRSTSDSPANIYIVNVLKWPSTTQLVLQRLSSNGLLSSTAVRQEVQWSDVSELQQCDKIRFNAGSRLPILNGLCVSSRQFWDAFV